MISEISQPASANIRPARDSFAWTHRVSSASHWRDQRSTQGLSTGYQAWDLTRECSTQGPSRLAVSDLTQLTKSSLHSPSLQRIQYSEYPAEAAQPHPEAVHREPEQLEAPPDPTDPELLESETPDSLSLWVPSHLSL